MFGEASDFGFPEEDDEYEPVPEAQREIIEKRRKKNERNI